MPCRILTSQADAQAFHFSIFVPSNILILHRTALAPNLYQNAQLVKVHLLHTIGVDFPSRWGRLFMWLNKVSPSPTNAVSERCIDNVRMHGEKDAAHEMPSNGYLIIE